MAWNWGIGVIAFAFGLGVGFLLAYLLAPRSGRIQALEGELRAAQSDHAAYRGKVDQHFRKTAELFEDMTGRYRAVYQHMASGAQMLCEERPPSLQLEITDRGQLANDPAPRPPEDVPATDVPAESEAGYGMPKTAAPHSATPDDTADSDDYLGDAPQVPELTDEVEAPSKQASTGAPRPPH
ncbi:MAG: DUF1043 family protein [Thiohalobacteraceae bacterium]